LWVWRYDGPGNSSDAAASVARSADGRRVFVTGTSDGGPATGLDYATVAYRASTGARLWAARYNGPSSGDDMANAVAVSPDGSKVFVTGRVRGLRLGEEDYATVAYRASTGVRLWASVYRGPVKAGNAAYSVAASLRTHRRGSNGRVTSSTETPQ
jgi:DNA-binding beta-propeller fold protein YncE